MGQRHKPSDIWTLAEKNIRSDKSVDVEPELDFVRRYLADNEPDLWSGWPPPARSQDDIVQLARDISYRASEEAVQIRFAYLAAGFEIGNTSCGWRVPLVPQLVRVKKPLNWPTRSRFAWRQHAKKFEEAFGRDLESPIPNTPGALLGRILFSAMMFGALLDRKWLTPFVQAVSKREFYQYRGVLWIEMVKEHKRSTDWENGENSTITRRYFPDHFTQALLYRGLDMGLLPTQKSDFDTWDILSTYIKRLPGLSSADIPSSLGEFLNLCVGRNLLLPGSLLSYATGKIKSTSLPIAPWLRCITNKAIPVSRPLPAAQEQKFRAPKVYVNPKFNHKKQEKIFTDLLKQISPQKCDLSSGKSRGILVKTLQNHKHEISCAFQLLLHWGKQLLSPRLSYREQRRKQAAVKTSTVRRYFQAIGTAFLEVADSENILELDITDLEQIYEDTLLHRMNDSMAPQCLGQFHAFLTTFYGLQTLEGLELKGAASEGGNDNANLIALDVYQLILQALGWEKKKKNRWQKLRILAWIICYRCGLRPAEVINLKTINIQETNGDEFEILIKRSKTERGRRRIPGTHFLPRDERKFFLDYLHERRGENGLFGDDYLLAHPEQKSGKLVDSELFDPIRKLLKVVTKDETLRLYHARHTFNSALNLQFILKGHPPFNLSDYLNLGLTVENDEKLRGLLLGNEQWGRKDQYIQAIVVGHSTPIMTNKYYNHLNDVALGCKVRQARDMVAINIKTIQTFKILEKSRAAELLTVSEGMHPLAKLNQMQASRWESHLQHPFLAESTKMKAPPLERSPDSLPPWEDVLEPQILKNLKRGEANWEMAKNIYLAIRQLDGRRAKTAKVIISEMYKSISESKHPWPGPTFSSYTALNKALNFLLFIGIGKGSISLIFHPRRNQTEVQKTEQLKKWEAAVKIDIGIFSCGKTANIKGTPMKGLVELRIGSGGTKKLQRVTHMNSGFLTAIKIISKIYKSRSI